jgi:hypothetical protein
MPGPLPINRTRKPALPQLPKQVGNMTAALGIWLLVAIVAAIGFGLAVGGGDE